MEGIRKAIDCYRHTTTGKEVVLQLEVKLADLKGKVAESEKRKNKQGAAAWHFWRFFYSLACANALLKKAPFHGITCQ